MTLRFDNTYAALPERFYSRVNPEPVASPEVIRVNDALAEQLGFDVAWLKSDEGAAFAVGNKLLEGADPIATVYGGHQFGNWAGQLGDGRAVLLGELLDQDGERFDLQLKGSGRTPYSRGGDGRAPLGPVLREYVVSEAMQALAIPTSRALMAATTGESVRRRGVEPGGVIVRVAQSHIRIGTFQYFASQGDGDAIRTLAEYVLERHYPDLEVLHRVDGVLAEASLLALLRAVAERQSELVAKWQLVGFIHGVMNTDNMLLSGETIDYGPCAFMNEYDPATVYSSIDRQGRYAYGNQPRIAQWNVSRLAQALLGATEAGDAAWDAAQAVIDEMPEMFRVAYSRGMGRKLGLATLCETQNDEDWALIEDLLELMFETNSDYTLTFVRLTELLGEDAPDARAEALAKFGGLPSEFDAWVERWRARMTEEDGTDAERLASMRAENPVFIPRNHQVEAVIEAAVSRGDFAPFHQLVEVLARPFDYAPSDEAFARPPRDEERVEATFCGT
ncbi:protein adenylyltransferase SelO [Bradymonas sediminis]|uniref:Protein nucleotidyltransferase YdiU n=1 Tax=Bradymonas sediminis TaxID=1548548 RepID=A0A2Z4FIV5_9DELT|nr:YdiU family protein [Bradymonas sediminis]AWV88849.1 YdiU family protein [Bradymonas sediminis]TDP71852.1 uncharacterized protein YdiU (UPF0061 family) [Bradymonas sediminis]